MTATSHPSHVPDQHRADGAPGSPPAAPPGDSPEAATTRRGRDPALGLGDEPQTPAPAEPDVEPRSGGIRNAAIAATATVAVFVTSIVSDALGNLVSNGPALTGLLAFGAVIWLIRRVLERGRINREQLDSDLVAPGPAVRPAWFREPACPTGRAAEVQRAIDIALQHRIVAVVGPPGMGSSAVAEYVVDQLVHRQPEEDGAEGRRFADRRRVSPFDLRGWSSEHPDDAFTIAGHLLRTFQAAPPSSSDPTSMREAASRLIKSLPDGGVLFLDNITRADQISWLVKSWRAAKKPVILVLAGDEAVGAEVPQDEHGYFSQRGQDGSAHDPLPQDWADSVVRLDPLSVDELHDIWCRTLRQEHDQNQGESHDRKPQAGEDRTARQRLHDAWTDPQADWFEPLVKACAGRPGALCDLAHEIARPKSHWTPDDLQRLWQSSAFHRADPRERIWMLIWETAGEKMSRRAQNLAFALAALPVAELTVEAMEAVRRGLEALDPAQRSPHTGVAQDVHDPIAELFEHRFVRQLPIGRYRMPREVRQAIRHVIQNRAASHSQPPFAPQHDRAAATPSHDGPEQPDNELVRAVRAALPALIQRYADLAERWRQVLANGRHARSASRWFRAEEPLLRVLATADYSALAAGADDRRPDAGAGVRQPDASGGVRQADTDEPTAKNTRLADVIDDLARIDDALDVWYQHDGQASRAAAVHENFHALATTAGRPDLAELSEIRLAGVARSSGDPDLQELPQKETPVLQSRWPWSYRWWRSASALRARRHHENALRCLVKADQETDPAEKAYQLSRAEHELKHVWTYLPKRDITGEVTTLLTLAAVYLHQRRPDRALARLELAASRAEDAGDGEGYAYATELSGIAAWMQGRAPIAAAAWSRALQEYRRLDNQLGEARCLQHLGSAVFVAPELAGLLIRDERRVVTQVTAVHLAMRWLTISQRLREGHGQSTLGARYLEQATRQVESLRLPQSRTPPTELDTQPEDEEAELTVEPDETEETSTVAQGLAKTSRRLLRSWFNRWL
jgi:tetratricopeptide (TPR) repeat protein